MNVKRIFKNLLLCTLICVAVSIPLIIINAIAGVHISMSYYLAFILTTSLGLGLGLNVYKFDSLRRKSRPVVKRTVVKKVRRRPVETINRKIS